jgi:hypothetical protein
MNTAADLAGIERSTYRDTMKDGLTEIAAGVFLFTVALAYGRPAFVWTYIVGIFVLGPGLKRLKARITYPRIGYAELPEEEPRELGRGIISWVLVVVAVAVVALAISGDLTDNRAWRQWSPTLAGFITMGGFLYMASRSGLARHYVYVVASPALGLLLSVQRFSEPYDGIRIWALLMSLLTLATGGFVLWRFLNANPIVDVRGPEGVPHEPDAESDLAAPDAPGGGGAAEGNAR